jgi:predicted AAA+ superfamily ATPase
MTRLGAVGPQETLFLSNDIVQILNDLNPWWETGTLRKAAQPYQRRGVPELLRRVTRPQGLIEVIRGPRQVGKTTAIEQIIDHLLRSGTNPTDILFVRFDQEVLRDIQGGLLRIIRWFETVLRARPFQDGAPAFVFLDEVHKLDNWDEDVKHVGDTYPIRLVLTGSSSVLVSRGGRESLAGRILTTDFPTFQFREVLEAWEPIAKRLPPVHPFDSLFTLEDPRDLFDPFISLRPQQKHSLRRHLERYYNRGGYPRLYNGEVSDDLWADYLTETIFNRVLGVDVPDLFPVQNPRLLRWIYIEVARATGQEIVQNRLAEDANSHGFATSQPHVGKYIHYLADALLIREFQRYPLAKRANARMPAKITLTDLGARNAVFRGAPSLWESSPEHVGPLIETLAQSVIRGPNVQVHFFRDHEKPGNRMSKIREVDFISEDLRGQVIPIEIKFRRSITDDDFTGLSTFVRRFGPRYGLMVTRHTYEWRGDLRILCVPLLEFLLAF